MPGFFDDLNIGDPNTAAWLGLAQGFGRAAMPQRVPMPLGAVVGQAAEGLQTGMQSAQAYRGGNIKQALEKVQTVSGNIKNMNDLETLNMWRSAFGQAPLTIKDLGGVDPSTLHMAAQDAPNALPAAAARNAGSTGAPGAPTLVPQQPAIEVNHNAPEGAPDSAISGNPAAPGLKPAATMPDGTRVVAPNADGGGTVGGASGGGAGEPVPQMSHAATPASGLAMLFKNNPKLLLKMRAGIPLTPLENAQAYHDSLAPGDPARVGAARAVAKEQGIDITPNVRPGATLPMWNPEKNQYEVAFHSPVIPEGHTIEIGPDGKQRAVEVPGAIPGIGKVESTKAGARERAILAREQTFAESQFVREHGITSPTATVPAAGPGGPGPGATTPPAQAPVPAAAPRQAVATAPLPGSVAAPVPTPEPKNRRAGEQPIPTEQGTLIPPVSAQAPIGNRGGHYVKERQTQFAKTENEWNEAQTSGYIAEQRAVAIADAFKVVESGGLTTRKAELSNVMRGLGLGDLADTFMSAKETSAVQEALKNNFASVLQQIKSFSSRPAAAEVVLGQKNFSGPDLMAPANLKIIAETVGSLRWERALLNDWAEAKGIGWQDPQDFARAWRKENKNSLQGFVDAAEKEIGPLKGMEPPKGDTGNLAPTPAKLQLIWDPAANGGKGAAVPRKAGG